MAVKAIQAGNGAAESPGAPGRGEGRDAGHPPERRPSHARVFDECYAAHRDRVYRWARRYGTEAWAEDLVHDVFVRLWDHLPALDDHTDLGGWLYRVTANLAVSRLRGERTFVQKVARIIGVGEDTHVPGPDAALESKQLGAAAMVALQALPDRQRVALAMKFIDGRSQREIADTLGMSEGYVSKLVSRGIAALQAAGWEVTDDAS